MSEVNWFGWGADLPYSKWRILPRT